MCDFMSFIVTKTGNVLYSKNSFKHEDIIKENNLDDTKHSDFKTFCRIEITPTEPKKFDQPIKEWILKIDEEEKPEWWTEKHEKKCREKFESIVYDFLKINCKHEINTGYCIGYNATIISKGNAKTYLYCKSTSEHYDTSTSEHYNQSTSKHYNTSTSKHYRQSTSEHYDTSISEHYGQSTSEHYNTSTSEHYDTSISEHNGQSTSKHYGQSTSKHYGQSIGIKENYHIGTMEIKSEQAQTITRK